MRISACVITKNEEKNIERSIKSYKNIVNEIILVDTGSNDRTVEIAKSLGAKVFYYAWNNDFAAAKNFAISKVKGDWIIFLDADEYFDGNCTKRIPEILTKIDPCQHNVIGCKLINLDKVSGRTIDSFLQMRIFKNDKNIRYTSSIHERLVNHKGKINILALYDEIIVYHTGYSLDINKDKAQRNLDMLLEDIKKNGENPEYYQNLCDCYFSLGDYENAIYYGRLHLKSGVNIIGYQSRIYKVIIDSMYLLKYPEKQIEEEIVNSIELFADHPNFYCSYAYFLLDHKRYEQALGNFLKTIQKNKKYDGLEVNFTLGLMENIYLKIGFIYVIKDCMDKALDSYFECVKVNRFNTEAFQGVFDIIRNEKAEDIIFFINNLFNIHSEKDVQFVLDELIKVKPRTVLAYYYNIWSKRYGHEDHYLTFTFLAEGKYDTAFQIFYEGYLKDYNKTDAILMIVSAILIGSDSNLRKVADIVTPSLMRIMKAYLGENIQLAKEDTDDYIAIFKELLLFNDKDAIKSFEKLKEKFNYNICSKVGRAYMDNHLYEAAIKIYEEFNIHSGFKDSYMAVGYCYFKMRNYQKAYEYFRKAIQDNYRNNDILEFLRWTGERCQDGMLKEDINSFYHQISHTE